MWIILQEMLPNYTKPLQKYKNPRRRLSGRIVSGIRKCSLGGQTGATPDGRDGAPVADGVSPSTGKDVKGPTAAATSIPVWITLSYQMEHCSIQIPSIRTFRKRTGEICRTDSRILRCTCSSTLSSDTLLDAQKHPEKYKHLVVRVAGYSALFTTLSRNHCRTIISRTEQDF